MEVKMETEEVEVKVEEKVIVGTKRKMSKEKRFRQNVKGFAKIGNYGRGSYLEEEQAKYFLNILDVLKEDFETVDVKSELPLGNERNR